MEPLLFCSALMLAGAGKGPKQDSLPSHTQLSRFCPTSFCPTFCPTFVFPRVKSRGTWATTQPGQPRLVSPQRPHRAQWPGGVKLGRLQTLQTVMGCHLELFATLNAHLLQGVLLCILPVRSPTLPAPGLLRQTKLIMKRGMTVQEDSERLPCMLP